MNNSGDIGNLPPNLNHRERNARNPNLEVYVIAIALTAILLNFSDDFMPYVLRIPTIIIVVAIIAAVSCSVPISRYFRTRAIILVKDSHETKFNTLKINKDTEIVGIEVLPHAIGNMTLREQTLFKSSFSKIWMRMPDNLILISMNFNNADIPVNEQNTAMESYSTMIKNIMGNTFYFRHFILLKKETGVDKKGKTHSDIVTIEEQLASIGMEFKRTPPSLLEKLWREFP